MGRLEKIVVLTVVFLIAVILGLSLHEREDARGPVREDLASLAGDLGPTPASPAREEPAGRLLPQPRITAPPAERASEERGEPAARQPRTRGLLSSEAQVSAPAEQPSEAPAEAPEKGRGLLVRTTGLAPTPYDPDLFLYTWRRGDTFASVARAFYGDSSRARILRNANEGRGESSLRAGAQIFVPAREPEPGREAARPGAGGDTYVVVEGDTLSGIALRVLGDATRYMDLYEANLDVLSSPDDLALGQVLRIPK